MELIAILVVFLPLLSGLVNGLFCGYISKKTAGIFSGGIMIFVALLASLLFDYVGIGGNVMHLTLFKWFKISNLKVDWAILVDELSVAMFLLVTVVSAVVHIYSLGYMQDDENLQKFLSFLSLFTFFMLILVCASNFIQLFFGWEGVGLCSYLLIGFWHKKDSANNAALKAFIVNRIADCALIIGIVLIIIHAQSLDFVYVFKASMMLAHTPIDGYTSISVLDVICILLFIGCMGKSAQIGLHIWLPDAMEGPTPVSALIHAATMVTAVVFLLARCSYLFEYSRITLDFLRLLGSLK